MDVIDKQLLNLLQEDSSLTVAQLSNSVPLSPSAISRRLKRLADDQVIWREVVLVAPSIRETRLTVLIQVQLDRHHPREWEKLKQILNKAPEVQWCLEVTGTFDVVLIVSVKDMQHFNEFTDALSVQPLVRRYEAIFVKRHVKTSPAVPLD